MSRELAGAADIITGVASARRVEPEAGAGLGAKPGNCLNCNTLLTGSHCHGCGQKAQVHRTLHAFGHDILHSVLHFDGKIWRTFPMLFFKPGELTRRYVHGERAKFVSPLGLFLFTVFFTFATFNWLVPKDIDVNPVVAADVANKQYHADRKDILKDIAELQGDKKEVIAEGMPGNEWIDGEVARLRGNLKALEDDRGKEIRTTELTARTFITEKAKIESQIVRLEVDIATAEKTGRPTAELKEQLKSARLGLKMINGAAMALAKGETPTGDWRLTDLNFWGSDRVNSAVKHAAENPQLLFYKIQSNAYKYSWALIPISVPFLWLLFFWQRRFKLFDHAVFVTYSLCFMMTLGAVCSIILSGTATDGVRALIVLSLIFMPPIHIYKQLKYAYGVGRFGAAWRTFALSMFAIAALLLFIVLVIALGITE
jgi:hypothetical protein